MSALMNVNPDRFRAASRLCIRPRTRLSRTRTSAAPASRSWSTIVDPMSPAPPVTSTVDPPIRFAISANLLERVRQRVDHGVLLGLGHFREQWDRQALARYPL